MKTITLDMLRVPLVLVELPEGRNIADYVEDYDEIGLPNLIAKFKDIPEEVWAGLVHSTETHGSWPFADIFFLNYLYEDYSCSTPKESVLSAIEAAGWYKENPMGTKPKVSDFKFNTEKEELDLFKWQQAQDRTLNLDRVWVFRKEVGK